MGDRGGDKWWRNHEEVYEGREGHRFCPYSMQCPETTILGLVRGALGAGVVVLALVVMLYGCAKGQQAEREAYYLQQQHYKQAE